MITFTPISGSSSSVQSDNAQVPLCYLLQVDEVNILLDLGGYDPRKPSSSSRTYEYEEKIRELSPKISLVLLSHSPTSYLSLYPFARTHWGLRCPVYATQPTVEMGRVVCLEEVSDWRDEVEVEGEEQREGSQSQNAANKEMGEELFEGEQGEKEREATEDKGKKPLRGPFVCTAEQVNEAFNWIKAVRYNQPVHMAGMLSHLLLTPYSSGHTLGGTIFKLRSPTSGSIVYAVGMNHTTERHLDPTVLLPGAGTGRGSIEGLQRPDLLIAEGGRSLIVGAKQKDRAKALLDIVTNTLRAKRSLLFPVDASPRLLELLILLDQHRSFQIAQDMQNRSGEQWNHPICLVSRTGQEMMAFARSLLEWMGGSVAREEDEAQSGSSGRKRQRGAERTPFTFRHIQFFPTADALMHAFPKDLPKLVLAVPISLNYGPSRLFFKSMAADAGNVIVLTGRAESDSLAQNLFLRWDQGQATPAMRYGLGKVGDLVHLDGRQHVTIDSKVALVGKELEQHLEAQRQVKEKEAATKAAAERSRRMLEADDLESDSDSDADSADMHLDGGAEDDEAPNGLLEGGTGTGDAFAENEDVRATSFDIYVKGQQTRAVGFFRSGANTGAQQRFRMFPFVERKSRKVDIYGENLDVGAWLRKGKEIELEVESDEVKEAKRRKKEQDEKQQEPPEPPSKYISEEFDVELAANVAFIDMEGQHDGRAIKTMVPMLNPRRLIVVQSSKSATADLLNSLAAFSATIPASDVHAPDSGVAITIGEQTNQWGVNLSEGMMSWVNAGANGTNAKSKGKWSKYEDFEIAMITGRVVHSSEATGLPTLDLPRQREAVEEIGPTGPVARPPMNASAAIQEQEIMQDEAPDEIGDGQAIPGEAALMPDIKPFYDIPSIIDETTVETRRGITKTLQGGPNSLPRSMLIGDLRLTTLKTTLAEMGIPAEFVGEGTLLCGDGLDEVLRGYGDEEDLPDNLVVIKKDAEGVIEMEGSAHSGEAEGGEVYEQIRSVVYGAFARVVV